MKLLLWLTLPLFVLDQITKQMIVDRFAAPQPGLVDGVPVIEGFFYLVRVHNTGIAFGNFNGGAYSNLIFGAVAITALAAILFMWRREMFPTKSGRIAAALLISGILGNFVDRVFRGYVVDFLDFDLKFMRWPSFNVADSCICIAAGLLFLNAFLAPDPKKEAGKPEESAAGGEPEPEKAGN